MSAQKENPKVHKKIVEDFREMGFGGFAGGLKKYVQEIYYFYVNDDERKSLTDMSAFKRWIVCLWWVLKSLIFKLTPFRRILLVIAIAFGLAASTKGSTNFVSVAAFLIIVLLELKDRLLVRDELEAGRVVQKSLIPETVPEFSGWDIWMYTRPANDVGGDLVDYIKIKDKKLGIILGDVAGKGLGAALYMAKLQATIRAIVLNHKSLSEFGKELNSIFYRDRVPHKFASVFYIEIVKDLDETRLINAGHFPPYLIKGDTISELSKGGNAIGLAPDSEYVEESLNISKNDILFIYSDGLTEAMNEKNEFFGEERLKSVLLDLRERTPESICKRILTKINNFTGEALQNDDLSMIILKRK